LADEDGSRAVADDRNRGRDDPYPISAGEVRAFPNVNPDQPAAIVGEFSLDLAAVGARGCVNRAVRSPSMSTPKVCGIDLLESISKIPRSLARACRGSLPI
jgi:hypothetical protein